MGSRRRGRLRPPGGRGEAAHAAVPHAPVEVLDLAGLARAVEQWAGVRCASKCVRSCARRIGSAASPATVAAIAVDIGACQLIKFHRMQQAAGHALREGRADQRDDRHAAPTAPRRRWCGRCTARRRGRRRRKRGGSGGHPAAAAARTRRRSAPMPRASAAAVQRRLHVGVPLQQPQHRIGHRLQERAPAVEDLGRNLVRLVKGAQQQRVVGHAPLAAQRGAAARAARRSAGSSAAAARSSR